VCETFISIVTNESRFFRAFPTAIFHKSDPVLLCSWPEETCSQFEKQPVRKKTTPLDNGRKKKASRFEKRTVRKKTIPLDNGRKKKAS
jgi:hypothetical protein